MLEIILKFSGEHVFLAWCALWLGWGLIAMILAPIKLIWFIVRMSVVCVRGWPPAHLNADGEWKKEEQSEKKAA